jgi:hypothetical protein
MAALPTNYPLPAFDPTLPVASQEAMQRLVAQLQLVPGIVGGDVDNLPPFLQKILAIARGDTAMGPGSNPVVLPFTTGSVVLAILADYFDLNDTGTADQLRKEAAILALVRTASGA